MKEDEMSNAIAEMQISNDYLILDNAFSSPKFVKQLSKTEYKLAKTDTYTLKLFAELLSRLNYEILENTTEVNQIKIEINIKDFLNDIGIGHNMGYSYVIEASRYLKTLMLQWKEKDGIIKESVFVSYSEHNPKTGKVSLFIPQQFAKRVLDVGMKENFSFLKQNLFKLENNQAIKLYQFFKSWQNKGVYQTDLERFKEQFGYNTSGYKLYSKFKERVLEPATKEINNKTDIIVSYQTTGDNLESLRPRVKGLIFTIKAKGKDIKQLPNRERHQTPHLKDEKTHISNLIKAVAPQEQTAQPQKIQLTDQPSHVQIVELGEKLKLNNIQVQTIMDELKGNHIRAFEVLQGCINEGKAKIINSNFAYIIGSINTLGVGLWQQEQAKAKKKEAEKIEKEKQATIQKIQTDYQDRKKAQFLKLYASATDQEKTDLLEHIRETKTLDTIAGKRNYHINKETNQLNEGGEVLAGSILAEQKNTGIAVRQNKFRNEIFEKYGYQIDFDDKDQVIILGLFENVEQQPTSPPSIEATESPKGQEQTTEEMQTNRQRILEQRKQARVKKDGAIISKRKVKTESIQEVKPTQQKQESPKEETKNIITNLTNKFTSFFKK
jgi:plasmid replication initiation protein